MNHFHVARQELIVFVINVVSGLAQDWSEKSSELLVKKSTSHSLRIEPSLLPDAAATSSCVIAKELIVTAA